MWLLICSAIEGMVTTKEMNQLLPSPLCTKKIAKHPTTRQIYADRLIKEGVCDSNMPDNMVKAFHSEMEDEFKSSATYKPDRADWLEGKWEGLVQSTGEEETKEFKTGVPMEDLLEVGRALSTPPKQFNVNRKIIRQLKNKAKMFETGNNIDWSTGEALAFGTILQEGIQYGYLVRIVEGVLSPNAIRYW